MISRHHLLSRNFQLKVTTKLVDVLSKEIQTLQKHQISLREQYTVCQHFPQIHQQSLHSLEDIVKLQQKNEKEILRTQCGIFFFFRVRGQPIENSSQLYFTSSCVSFKKEFAYIQYLFQVTTVLLFESLFLQVNKEQLQGLLGVERRHLLANPEVRGC